MTAVPGEPGGRDTQMRTLLRPYRRKLLAGSLLMVLSVGLLVAIPRVLQIGFDALLRARASTASRAALGLVALVLAQGVVRVLSRVTMFDVGRLVEYDLRRLLLDRLHRLGSDFYRRFGTGEIMSRSISDLGNIRLLFGFGLVNVVGAVTTFVLVIASMLSISAELTFVSLSYLPLLVLLVRVFGRRMFTRTRDVQNQLGAMTSRVQESLTGVRVVRAYGTESHEIGEFERMNERYMQTNLSLTRIRGLLLPAMTTITGMGLLLTIVWGGRLVLRGEITLGALIAMQGYVWMLSWPTTALGFVVSIVQRGQVSWIRIRDVIDAVPSVADSGSEELERLPSGDLEVSHLSFAYDGRPVLADVSFRVPRGGSIAIVGRTGSGKSTLAHLLPRLLPLPPGTVRVRGVDVTRVKLRALRRNVGYSPQEPFLFSTTIAANVGFGLEDPGAPDAMDRIRAACRSAQIEVDILSFPDGYDTVVGERGVQLSGGQKQRIALARALVGRPDILVLDDPMSAVDASTEARILAAIDEAARGRTLVLVTHRCSAAQHADRILVLDEGRIVEEGSHEELVAEGGLYARFWTRQRLEAELEQIGTGADLAGAS